MLKSLFPSWYKKKLEIVKDAPQSFMIEDTKHWVEFRVPDEADSFVDINCKKLTYAEVASMSMDRPQSVACKKYNNPAMYPPKNCRVLQELDDNDEPYEKPYEKPQEKINSSTVFPEKDKKNKASKLQKYEK